MQIEKYFFRWKKCLGRNHLWDMRKAKWSKLLCEIIFVGIKWKEIQNCLAFWKKEPNAKDKLQSYKEKVQKMKMKSPQKTKTAKNRKNNKSVEICWKQGFQQISTDFIFSNFGCFFFLVFFFCGAFVLFSSGSPLFFVNFGLEIDVFCVSLFLVLSWYLLVLFFLLV